MSDLKEIVARARNMLDLDRGFIEWVVAYEDLVEELEAIIAPPDPPQAHIPGLDQTEWGDA